MKIFYSAFFHLQCNQLFFIRLVRFLLQSDAVIFKRNIFMCFINLFYISVCKTVRFFVFQYLQACLFRINNWRFFFVFLRLKFLQQVFFYVAYFFSINDHKKLVTIYNKYKIFPIFDQKHYELSIILYCPHLVLFYFYHCVSNNCFIF